MSTATGSRYRPHGQFHAELKKRVDAYFESEGRVKHGGLRMVGKSVVMFSWLIASYLSLLLLNLPWWGALLAAISLGLAMAGIGFSVQHDGGHGGYSKHRFVNRATAFSLDLIGGSSYIWNWKHNVFHHSNPNVAGLDVDIDIRPFCRLSPGQPLRVGHRFQHLYIWALYGFLAAKWHFVDDFKDIIRGAMGNQNFPRPRGWTLVALLLGKAFFFTWMLVIPALMFPLWQVALAYVVVSATASLSLALTFQLAHVVEGATFPVIEPKTGQLDVEWAVHQVQSSANFAPDSSFLNWYLGGLNFQIEHHLFPKVSHLHLRSLAKIVEATCREFGVEYKVNHSAFGALASHARWVRDMGQPAPAPVLAV